MAGTDKYFDDIFNNAKANAILVMEGNGIVIKVNDAFTAAYGYTTEDLASKHFRILFIEKDQVTRRPEIELNTTHREGASSDENYLVHKDGTPIWVTGESILIRNEEKDTIVKIIHNIHAQKQLERYLLSASDLLDSLFESVQQRGLLVLDGSIRVVKANSHFNTIFGLTEPIVEGIRLQQIPHAFWSNEEIKNDIRNTLISGAALQKEYLFDKTEKAFRRLHITSKIIMSDEGAEKKILLVIKEAQ